MDQRVAFIADSLRAEWTMTELAERHQISRKTAFKWVDRYAGDPAHRLADHSRARIHHGRAIGLGRLMAEALSHASSGAATTDGHVGQALARSGETRPSSRYAFSLALGADGLAGRGCLTAKIRTGRMHRLDEDHRVERVGGADRAEQGVWRIVLRIAASDFT